MDDDAKAEVMTLPSGTADALQGKNTGVQHAIKSASGSKVMVLETVLKECGLIPSSGKTEDTRGSTSLGSQRIEAERQRWMQVRHVVLTDNIHFNPHTPAIHPPFIHTIYAIHTCPYHPHYTVHL